MLSGGGGGGGYNDHGYGKGGKGAGKSGSSGDIGTVVHGFEVSGGLPGGAGFAAEECQLYVAGLPPDTRVTILDL